MKKLEEFDTPETNAVDAAAPARVWLKMADIERRLLLARYALKEMAQNAKSHVDKSWCQMALDATEEKK